MTVMLGELTDDDICTACDNSRSAIGVKSKTLVEMKPEVIEKQMYVIWRGIPRELGTVG
jgi:hypothetical protein